MSFLLFFLFGTVAGQYLAVPRTCSSCLCLSALDLPTALVTIAGGEPLNTTDIFCGNVYATATTCYLPIVTSTSSFSCVALNPGATLRLALRYSGYGRTTLARDLDSFDVLATHPHIAVGVMRIMIARPWDEMAQQITTREQAVTAATIASVVADYNRSLTALSVATAAMLRQASDNATNLALQFSYDVRKLGAELSSARELAVKADRDANNPNNETVKHITNWIITNHLEVIAQSVLNPFRNDAAKALDISLAAANILILLLGLLFTLPRMAKARDWFGNLASTLIYPDASYYASIFNSRSVIAPMFRATPWLTYRATTPKKAKQVSLGLHSYGIAIGGVVCVENDEIFTPVVTGEVYIGTIRDSSKCIGTSAVVVDAARRMRDFRWIRQADGGWRMQSGDKRMAALVLTEYMTHARVDGILEIIPDTLWPAYTAIPDTIDELALTPAVVMIVGPNGHVLRSIRLKNAGSAMNEAHMAIEAELASSRDAVKRFGELKLVTDNAAAKLAEVLKDDVTSPNIKTVKEPIIMPVPSAKVREARDGDVAEYPGDGGANADAISIVVDRE